MLKNFTRVIVFWTLLVTVWKLMLDLLLFKRSVRKRKNIRASLLFMIGQKEGDLIFFQKSLLFVAKHSSTFKQIYLLRKELFP